MSYHRYYCCTYQVLYVESQKNALTAQFSPSTAQQRSAVRCRTVPCLALRCCAVLRCAFFRTYSSSRYHATPGTDRYICTCVLVFFSLSSFDCPLSVLLCFFSKIAPIMPYSRSERDPSTRFFVRVVARSFHHARRGPILIISRWLITSSAQRRSAVQCRSLACPAVRCGPAVRCCAVWLFEVSYHRYYCCTYQVLCVESQKNALTAQLSPAIAQQHSAVRCRTVPCLTLWCCAVLRCAFFRAYSSSRYHATPGTDGYACTCVYSSFSFFRFLHLIVLSRSSFFLLENYTHTGDQNVTSPTSTMQLRAISSAYKAAPGIIKSLDAPSHGSLLSAAFTFSCILPCASVAGGVPRSGALVLFTNRVREL